MSAPILAADHLSKWYGQVIGLNDVTVSVPPGITGLLGPNGAGKSTFMKLVTGQLRPSKGAVRVLGEPIWGNAPLYVRIGFCPEQDAFYERMTGLEWVTALVRLNGLGERDALEAAERALGAVDLLDVASKRIGAYSKGMRQRVKLAQALVHSPEVLLLDEPLNGLDPVQRRHVVELIRRLGSEGRTVLVSSHVLPEVERMAPRVVVLVNGRLVAEGETGAIRDLIRDRPRTVRIAAGAGSQALARELVGEGLATGVHIDDGVLVVETGNVDTLGRRLMPIARDVGATLERIEPLGDDLESVYTYLTDHARGRGR